MEGLAPWCRVTVTGPDGTTWADSVLEGPGAPDLGAVHDVARHALLAARLGGDIAIIDVSPAMAELLELAGLGVEVQWQTEMGEQTVGIQEGQEEAHPFDPPP